MSKLTDDQMREAWQLTLKKHLRKKWPKWSWIRTEEAMIYGAFDDLPYCISLWTYEMNDRWGDEDES